MTPATSKNVEQLEKDLKKLQQDMQSLTKAVSGDLRNGIDEFARRADKQLTESGAQARAAALQGRDRLADTVSENPFLSLAAATGVGLVIGALLRR